MKKILASLVLAGATLLPLGASATSAPVPSQCSGQTASQTYTAGREVIKVTRDNTVVYVNSDANSVKVSGTNDCVVVNGNQNSVTVTGVADVVVINGSSNSVNGGNATVVDNGNRNSTKTTGTFEGNGTNGTINGHAYTAAPPVEPLTVALKTAAKHVR